MQGASEEVLGRALRELAVPREQVVVATKVFNAMGKTPNEKGLSAKHIRHAIDASLKRLQLDYVDLYQIHRFDSTAPVAHMAFFGLSAIDAVELFYRGPGGYVDIVESLIAELDRLVGAQAPTTRSLPSEDVPQVVA